jgi:hypothetical protein
MRSIERRFDLAGRPAGLWREWDRVLHLGSHLRPEAFLAVRLAEHLEHCEVDPVQTVVVAMASSAASVIWGCPSCLEFGDA